jgi:hypothetical protein
LIGAFMAVSRPVLGPRRSVLLAIVGVVFYTLLVGAGASVVRAAVMSSLALIAGRQGRRSWGLNPLAAATLLMTLQNPSVLWDVGFQLTAAATLGILLYGERWQALVAANQGSAKPASAADLRWGGQLRRQPRPGGAGAATRARRPAHRSAWGDYGGDRRGTDVGASSAIATPVVSVLHTVRCQSVL